MSGLDYQVVTANRMAEPLQEQRVTATRMVTQDGQQIEEITSYGQRTDWKPLLIAAGILLALFYIGDNQ